MQGADTPEMLIEHRATRLRRRAQQADAKKAVKKT
jgi:hypothetical protein